MFNDFFFKIVVDLLFSNISGMQAFCSSESQQNYYVQQDK